MGPECHHKGLGKREAGGSGSERKMEAEVGVMRPGARE